MLTRARVARGTALQLLMALLIGCGGSGSGDGNGGSIDAPAPTPAAFGLTTRQSVTGIAIPTTDENPGGLSGIALQRLAQSLDFEPLVYATGIPGEGRIAAISLTGKLYAVGPDTAPTTARVVLDLAGATPITVGGEQGLLGLAFDPRFTTNRAIYLQYSAANPRRTRVVRFTWDATLDRVDLASELVLLEIPQPFSNHKAGSIAFGPDGHLYIGQGDGGSGNDPGNVAQDPSSLLGKMLRIAPPTPPDRSAYRVPTDNPFVATAGTRPEIWAIGLRNPFRFAFDRESGALWVGDVGQGELEEIDIVRAGLNYGWRVFEGSRVNFPQDPQRPPYEPPVFEYPRTDGASVIGGQVYRGSRIGGLYGQYVFADFVSGRIWALEQNAGTVGQRRDLAQLASVTSIAEDNDGELLVTTIDGARYRFVSTGATPGGAPPERLSETGLFVDLVRLTAAGGLVEYDVNHGFWSDGTTKRRWIAVPDGSRIGFTATGAWTFPVGTVIVKHFEIAAPGANATRRLETRVLARRPSGWYGLSYRWRDDGSDADLLAGGARIPVQVAEGNQTITFDYEIPSRGECLRCHTTAAGAILGVRTGQLNRQFRFPAATDNQLRALNHVGYFDRDIGDAPGYAATAPLLAGTVALANRARAYLEVNCASCHRPLGGTPVAIDLRAETTLSDAGVVNVVPQAGDLGLPEARLIVPGNKERSVLWQRMRRLDATRMPPLASHRVDAQGVEVVGQWIDSL